MASPQTTANSHARWRSAGARVCTRLLLACCLSVASLGVALAQDPARASTASYRVLSIAEPADGETLFDNSGDVDIRIVVAPTLRRDAGDKFVLNVDELPVTPIDTTEMQLHALERGAHTLQASVVDRAGNVLISSPQVTFYLWEASALFPNRTKK